MRRLTSIHTEPDTESKGKLWGRSFLGSLVLFEWRELRDGFGMLLQVRNMLRIRSLSLIGLLSVALMAGAMVSPSQTSSQTQQPTPSTPPAVSPSVPSPQGGTAGAEGSSVCWESQPSRTKQLVSGAAGGGAR